MVAIICTGLKNYIAGLANNLANIKIDRVNTGKQPNIINVRNLNHNLDILERHRGFTILFDIDNDALISGQFFFKLIGSMVKGVRITYRKAVGKVESGSFDDRLKRGHWLSSRIRLFVYMQRKCG